MYRRTNKYQKQLPNHTLTDLKKNKVLKTLRA
jgi:hypothetical protein